MKNRAFVFPGQGTHYAGMGMDLAKNFREADEIYQMANDIMGIDIRKLCFMGPEEELLKTENSQPTIHTTSIAILKVLQKYGFEADVTAGFSLGQYSSLVYGGALRFEDTVKLVKKRGVLMQEAVPMGRGKMCAIVGLEREEVFSIVEESKHLGHIEPSNYNCPGQVIVAGLNAAVENASRLAIEKGAKSADYLRVSGPFHTELLVEAGIKLREELDKIDVKNPIKQYVDNVTGDFFTEKDDLKELLKEHVYKAVMWEDSVNAMLKAGVDTFIEIGPKSVLTAFNKRTAEKQGIKIKCYNIEDMKTLEEFLRQESPA
ncbi:MAG: fabD [Anaerosolibacter sp.]|jgi:[acyl-carrier-protein] S-malonyltransferase|uniref:ACP S-malonyltransferase n=1 Tax=Anaerosolibacter sp. TaxID=1872527 RepID=UPI00261F70ED|nr:ACP S-malonyltransferase [Anaerosolibacter sp.]MDF2545334.1 fabD [Anaerosolibacter sp.]